MPQLKMCIAGGALQGMEAVYLAGRAGYETFVIDRREDAPAFSLADGYLCCDICEDPDRAAEAICDCDVVMPANESVECLEMLAHICDRCGKPFLFDPDAYRISCSKERSNELMAEIGVPIPIPWPGCGFPMVVKPSSMSGSVGVTVARNENERARGLSAVERLGDAPVQQEYVSGKNVSIEVIGDGTSARSFITTEVVLDEHYDCKQVVCEPCILPPDLEIQFGEIGKSIAERIDLRGLMDVEAVDTERGLRVLEIDARIPSQTPAAIEAATGVNLLEELVCTFTGMTHEHHDGPGCAVYEHFVISDGVIRTCGEKEFAHVDRPYFERDFFGADKAITDFGRHPGTWRVTIINSGTTMQEVLHKRRLFITGVMQELGLDEFIDRSPEAII